MAEGEATGKRVVLYCTAKRKVSDTSSSADFLSLAGGKLLEIMGISQEDAIVHALKKAHVMLCGLIVVWGVNKWFIVFLSKCR